MIPVLSVSGVSHAFEEGAPVLNNIHLDVFASELLMLVGPSGSGKTTLIHILGQLLRPTAGFIRLHGEEVDTTNEDERARIRLQYFGFIFQAYNLFPMLTATENVMVSLDLLGNGKMVSQDRARALLCLVGLDKRLDAFPSELSIGQKQRVAIARALAADPPILIADEPTASLDSENGLKAMDLFRDMTRKDGRTVIIVTHDTRIFHFADRILHLVDGRISDQSAVESVIARDTK